MNSSPDNAPAARLLALKHELRYVAALVGTNVRASLALRGAFWLQAGFMVLNNLLFFTTWWI